ncbi:MAG: DNA polymerase/3'-5' exonuclease PolX [Chloroflexi bacterium]|nr:DNA polymerase/3'-5' exonuclease PolX [Chloroflexota bacterium]
MPDSEREPGIERLDTPGSPDNQPPPPDNLGIARVFADIATLLQLKGESVFKIRAYTRAAEVFEHLPEPIALIGQDEDALKEIPGIGKAIAAKTHELVATGKLEFFEKLRGEFAPGLLEIMTVPEIGPKTAMRAAEELGIESLADLEAALRDGSFATLPRVGEKKAASILRRLETRLNQSDRMPIGKALPIAEHAIAELYRAAPGVRRLTVAGSLRRWRETAGDIDLLGVAGDPEAVTSAFANLPMVVDVLAQGGTKASVVVSGGVQIDLRVTGERYFGALLLYFTGSKQHGIRLRERAQRMGLSLNEYGLTDRESGDLTTFETEAEVYEALGLPYIPPEIREDLGEIPAAEAGALPDLVELADIRGDLHVHSDWSDGQAPVEQMVREAAGRGLDYVALTDHSSGRGIANGLSLERLAAHNREIEEVEAKVAGPLGIRVFKGSEVDIRGDGTLDYPDDVLADLDVVIASVHSGMSQSADVMTARIIRAIENPHVTAIGHLTTRFVLDRPPVEADFDAIFRAAARNGTLMEINASPKRLDLKDSHVRRARELGVRFLINTDAHEPENFDLLRYGVGTARRGWAEKRDILNTLPVAEIERFLATPKPQRAASGIGRPVSL